MTRLESDKVTVNKTAKEVFDFLSDFNNYQRLMPEQVTDWKSTTDECSFTIKGMASLGMKMKEKTPNISIVIEKNGKARLPLDLYSGEGDGVDITARDLEHLVSMAADIPADPPGISMWPLAKNRKLRNADTGKCIADAFGAHLPGHVPPLTSQRATPLHS